MESGRLHANPVGQLLVQRGLMSQEQLEDALLEQRVSRKRLGAILVDNRVVTAEDLSSALQAQVREVTDESGSDRKDPEPPPAPARKRRLFRRQERVVDDAPSATGPAPGQELVALTEAQNDELRKDVARQRTDAELTRVELSKRESRISELETHVKAVQQRQGLLVHALRCEIQELEHALKMLGNHRENGSSDASTALPPGATYLMLAPNADGEHTLRECTGVVPAVGGMVEHGGRHYVVASHRRSPLGTDSRICVHLQQG